MTARNLHASSCMNRRRKLLTDLLVGATAGVAATFVMDKVTNVLYERENRFTRHREDSARGGHTAYETAAEKVFGDDLDEDDRKQIGSAIHWSLGISAGVLYGLMRNRTPHLGIGSGLLFGALFFAAMDEGVVTILKLAPPPKAFPWQTHARGLAGHLVLGAVVEAPFDLMDAAA